MCALYTVKESNEPFQMLIHLQIYHLPLPWQTVMVGESTGLFS